MSTDLFDAAIASLVADVMHKRVTAATFVGFLLTLTMGDPERALAALPTHLDGLRTVQLPEAVPLRELFQRVREELRMVIEEQQAEASALLTRHEREPDWMRATVAAESGPVVRPAKFKTIQGGKHHG